MQILESILAAGSDEFRTNAEAMQVHIDAFRAVETKVQEKAEEAREKFHKRDKLLPRERIDLLRDRGSEFLELCSLAGYKMHDDKDGSMAGGGIIAGIGRISGIRCLIVASNSAIKGGTISPAGLDKTLRLQQIALENKLPVVSLSESGGANLNYATDIFVQGARGFANQARLSAAGIPQVTVVHGNATAGGAYQPGLSDYVIVVRNRAKLFLAGPPLLKAATGEVATDEELGGAEMHAQVAGTAEYLAQNDADGIRMAREILTALPWNESLPVAPERHWEEPRYPVEELLGVVPADAKKPYDVREILARIADGSRFLDFKPEYDNQTVCGFIKLYGYSVGIIGNNGPIDPDGAVKAAQFIQLCCQSGTPIIYLQNTTGYMVGAEYEQGGIIKDGAKMINAVSNSTVPHLTIVMGASYGAGNYGMCGRSYSPRFLFTWPNSRSAVMGPAQLAGVLSIVARESAADRGLPFDEEADAQMRAAVEGQIERESLALANSGRLYDDGIIDPRDTRTVLGFCLSVVHNEEIRGQRGYGVFRM